LSHSILKQKKKSAETQRIILNVDASDMAKVNKIIEDFTETQIYESSSQNLYLLYRLLKKLYNGQLKEAEFFNDYNLFSSSERKKKKKNKKKIQIKHAQTAKKKKKVKFVAQLTSAKKSKVKDVKTMEYDYEDYRDEDFLVGKELSFGDQPAEVDEYKLKLRKKRMSVY